MSYPVMPLGFLGSQGDNDTYKIERSLRFNSADSAYLNRTFSGTPTTYTMSFWVKRARLSGGTEQVIFGCRQGASNPATFSFGSTDNILFTSGPTVTAISTTALFRDVSSWYHIVVAVTPSATSYLYVNGSQIGTWTASSNPYLFNSAYTNAIGRYGDAAQNYLDGYLTEINFIDGQALTPSSFGETDSITGRWKAKAYTGTYGTNGFYLKFADNSGTTATTLGKDSSGNGNNWTPNNFSVTAGAGNDSLVDSPTNYGTDTGVGGEVRGNYATLNPLTGTSTLVDGNLRPSTTGVGLSTVGMSSGKWYCEQTVVAVGTTSDIGVHTGTGFLTYVGSTTSGFSYSNDGKKNTNASATNYGATYTSGDIIGCAFDADTGELSFYKNGVSQGVAFTGLTSGPYFFGIYGRSAATANNVYINFGQRPFAYAAPTGFKALCATNLPTPNIKKPRSAMDIVTYTGNGSARSITGLGFSPDLVWIKGRSGATDHAIYDSVRGVQKDLGSNLTTDETTQTQGLTAFNSDGFDIGTLAKINTNTSTYVAWAWDRAAIDGLDIVSYTGNGANRTISHNLGVAPKMIIVKARTTAGTDQGWPVYHSSLANTQYLLLNSTAAAATGTDYWNSTSPTSSVFSVGTNVAVNANNDTYIAYLFAEVEGFSKFGSYTGNGSADGPFVWCGFRPRWVMIKNATTGGVGYTWGIWDSSRDLSNVSKQYIAANASDADTVYSPSSIVDFNSNGFKIRCSNASENASGSSFIFAAFAESPFKYARAR